jgi:AraC-like DNA-binding protein
VTIPWLAAIADPARRLDCFAALAELPREHIGPRTADFHLLWLVLSGHYEGEVAGRPIRLRAGDLVWLPPGVPHLLVAPRRVRKFFMRLSIDAAPPAGQPAVARLGDEAATWFGALTAEPYLDDALRDGRVRALLGLLFSAWMRAMTSPAGGLDAERRGRLLHLVHSRPARRWSRDELGAALGLSGLHLSRLVTRSFGKPLRRWLVETRIHAAARELREHSGRIGEIAARYGYEDLFLFSRQFRQVMGVGPRAWRLASPAAGRS